LDELAELVAVARPRFDEREDEELGAALLEVSFAHMLLVDISRIASRGQAPHLPHIGRGATLRADKRAISGGTPMPREPKNYDHLVGKIKGLSEAQLKNHFTLYQGYVKKLNEIEQRLATADKATANYSYGEYSELKRREPVAYNGTYLHEMYFDNLGGE